MNLAEMMMSAGRDRDEGPGLTDEQQITRLQEYYAQAYAAEPEHFVPGQVIWNKNPDTAMTKLAKSPKLFIGYLPGPIDPTHWITDPADFGSTAASCRYDARMIVLVGEAAAEHFIDTRFYTATKPRSA